MICSVWKYFGPKSVHTEFCSWSTTLFYLAKSLLTKNDHIVHKYFDSSINIRKTFTWNWSEVLTCILTYLGTTWQEPFLKALDRVKNTLGLTETIDGNKNNVQILEDTEFLQGLYDDDEEDSSDMIQQPSNYESYTVLNPFSQNSYGKNIPTSPPPSLYQRSENYFRWNVIFSYFAVFWSPHPGTHNQHLLYRNSKELLNTLKKLYLRSHMFKNSFKLYTSISALLYNICVKIERTTS